MSDAAGVNRPADPATVERRLSDTQPSPGWGFICATCQHTWPDSEKYVDFPPSLPCKRIEYSRGGYDRSTDSPVYFAPAPVFELKRFADGSESCPSYHESEASE